MRVNVARAVAALVVCLVVTGCRTTQRAERVGSRLERQGDEIVIAGQYFHTGAPVVLWTDPGGFDAYRTERRFVPWERASFEDTVEEQGGKPGSVNSPARYGVRFAPRTASTQPTTGSATSGRRRGGRGAQASTTTAGTTAATRPSASTQPRRSPGERLTPEQFNLVRGGGWPLELVQQKVDQFVYHYDVCGTARQCFNILHDHRGLSVHFMLDVDGTIYQTLDVKERAYHATDSNDRSVGIEIANIGAYPPNNDKTLREWYRKDDTGKTRMVLPAWMNPNWIRTPNFVARPAREEAVVGRVQNGEYKMYDLTPEQYDSLIKLTAALCTALPKIKPDYPRDAEGNLVTKALSDSEWEQYQGLMGHYHVQDNKQDPGPAFQWDKVVNGARKLMGLKPLPEGDVINNPKQAVAGK